jgi:EpsI family protein
MMTGTHYWLMIAVLVGGVGSLHLATRREVTPLLRPLSGFPSALNGLEGRDMALEPWQIQALEIDEHLSRVYSRPGISPLVLYIGYYRSQRQGQIVHTPKNCLPGSGWEAVTSRRLLLDLADGRRAPVNYYVLEKGVDRQLVLYWYQAHGRIVASEYWGKFYTMVDAIRLNRTDASVVRISTPLKDNDEAQARERVLAFAQQAIANVDQVIPR